MDDNPDDAFLELSEKLMEDLERAPVCAIYALTQSFLDALGKRLTANEADYPLTVALCGEELARCYKALLRASMAFLSEEQH